MRAKSFCLFLTIINIMFVTSSYARENGGSTELTRVGLNVPAFETITDEGVLFNIEQLTGQIVLINFFTTTCGLCVSEMSELEHQIWKKFKNDNFTMIALGREHIEEEIIEFRKKTQVTFPMAPDPDREIYGKFATMHIPRNIILDKEGKIIEYNQNCTVTAK